MAEIDEPFLATEDIQGNILPGFLKSHQVLLGLKILDVRLSKDWIRFITPHISTAAEVFLFKKLRRDMMLRRGQEPSELSVVWTNIAFSAQGLRKLISPEDVASFEDEPFKFGLNVQSSLIGDPTDADDLEGSPKNWVVGGSVDKIPDIFMIIAGDLRDQLASKVAWIKDSLATLVAEGTDEKGLIIIYEEEGEDLPGDLGGHEHFGFKDGVSQPGIRGRHPEPPHDPITPRLIDPSEPLSRLFSKPGEPLVWPGQFVFGYPFQDDQVPLDIGRTKSAPDWARNGSFLVFRRLRQDVVRFWQFMHRQAEQIVNLPGFNDMDATKLASLLVGRWPSGAPIMRTPAIDDVRFTGGLAVNHFNFDQPARTLPIIPGSGHPDDSLPLAPADRDGFICPHAGHIRKVNPRDITTEQGNSVDVLQRRILRRGIPFGRVAHPEIDHDQGNRGLLFLSYQTSIQEQFEFLSRKWMNQQDAPEENPGGHDLIVGQGKIDGQRLRTAKIKRRVNGQSFEATITMEEDFVIPTGGGYFFAPSITALRNEISS